MSNATTLQVDRDAREVFNTTAIAIGTHDAEAAFDVCRKLVGLESHYRLALRVGDFSAGKPGDSEARDRGSVRRMAARFAGRCSKCSGPIQVDGAILYDPTTKQATHEGCGS